MPKVYIALVFQVCFFLASTVLAEVPSSTGKPTQYLLANGLGSACEGERDLISQALCYGRLAKRKNDLLICDKADHAGVKYQCYYIFAQHGGDPAVCDRIPDRMLEDGCYSDLAALQDDPAICRRIAGQGIKDSCYFKIATARADRALCGWIEDRGLRRGCMAEAGSEE